ncbi:hypothetical protein Ga0061065_1129 [Marinomonas fungiae]|uniref:Uncharacterized protein n=1 Tax=Marinomonas fungiae TaxID=1137284 RepID=A0A0K6IQM8_9GAMM|nr:hypothetical protein Ga0061065_1129 [Marinomonas fungiae]
MIAGLLENADLSSAFFLISMQHIIFVTFLIPIFKENILPSRYPYEIQSNSQHFFKDAG